MIGSERSRPENASGGGCGLPVVEADIADRLGYLRVTMRACTPAFCAPAPVRGLVAPRAVCTSTPRKRVYCALPVREPGGSFQIPYEAVVVRTWLQNDKEAAAGVIKNSLASYGLGWEPDGADSDAVLVDEFYSDGRSEFWVVEKAVDGTVVGTAALRRAERRPYECAEIRKMYLAPDARGIGLGSFMLDALEERARQCGYSHVMVETASVLEEAVKLYQRRGYSPIVEVDTPRCDMAMEKCLADPDMRREAERERVLAVDKLGHFVCEVDRAKARARRLLYAGVVTIVVSRDGDEIFVQKRSSLKKDFPGALDPFVAGAVTAGKDPSLESSARREMGEELGLDPEHFDWAPLWDGVYVIDRGVGDRCCFWGLVARAKRDKRDINVRFLDGEVTGGSWMSRAEVESAGLPSPVWGYVQTLAERGELTDEAAACPFFSDVLARS